MKFNQIITNPKFHLLFITILLLICFCFWQPTPMDDGGNYQAFIEKLVDQGKIDFSIPGFHGGDFIAAIIYFITHFHYATYLVDILAALLIAPLIYLVVKKIYGYESWAVCAAYLSALMPFQTFNALRGGHITLHLFFALWALYLLLKNKNYNWLILGISYTIYPFSIVLVPFYIYKKQLKQLFLSFIIPVIYLTGQWLQIGKIMMGQHANLAAGQLFSLKRFIPNIVYGLQNYLSIHNFSPYNPLYKMDMIHLSPLITVLTIIGIFYFSRYFAERKLFYTLTAFAILAFLLPVSFYRIDMFYFWMFNLSLIFLVLPVLAKYQRFIPFIIFTFSYQFFYFSLSYGRLFIWPYIVYIIPAAIFVIGLFYTIKSGSYSDYAIKDG